VLRAPRRCASPRRTGSGALSCSDVSGGCPHATAGCSATRPNATMPAIATRAEAQRTRHASRANNLLWAQVLSDKCREGSIGLSARAPSDPPIRRPDVVALRLEGWTMRPWRVGVLACPPWSNIGGKDTHEVPIHIAVGRKSPPGRSVSGSIPVGSTREMPAQKRVSGSPPCPARAGCTLTTGQVCTRMRTGPRSRRRQWKSSGTDRPPVKGHDGKDGSPGRFLSPSSRTIRSLAVSSTSVVCDIDRACWLSDTVRACWGCPNRCTPVCSTLMGL
jgi:hypothetical protein